jgi:hypothetical protein
VLKHIRETFTDEEWLQLKESKSKVNLNWHDLIITAITEYAFEYGNHHSGPIEITKELVEDAKF